MPKSLQSPSGRTAAIVLVGCITSVALTGVADTRASAVTSEEAEKTVHVVDMSDRPIPTDPSATGEVTRRLGNGALHRTGSDVAAGR